MDHIHARKPLPDHAFLPLTRKLGPCARIAAGLLLACLPGTLPAALSSSLQSRPLSPPSQSAAGTLFTSLPAGQTGIDITNNYADPAMWDSRYHEFEVGAIGTGVAIGDYDADGLPDIFVVSKTEPSRLYRNLGGFRFEDVTERTGIRDSGDVAIWKQGAAFVDVDNDGWLDLYLCRNNAPNQLYINRGDGTFSEEASARGLDLVDGSSMAAFCDYDRDGWLDVYIQTNLLDNASHPTGQPDYLYHNNGDGTFTDVSSRAGIAPTRSQGHSATWWDYDNDQWPDLYVANDFAVPDWLYRNNGDGTFTNVIDRVVPHMPYSAMGSDLGDINNDGLLDLLVAEMAATTHEKDMRTMAETRARARDPADDSTEAPNYVWSALYLNTGMGRMLEAAWLAGVAATDWTWSVRFEDLDNDGWLDLFITNGMHREIHNADLLYRMMTAESARDRVRIARASPILEEPNLAFRNLGDLRFEPAGDRWGLDRRGVSFGAAFGDLDGDGDLDLVHGNFLDHPSVLRNDGTAGNRVMIDLRGKASNRFGIGARVEIETASGIQVRQLVLARGYLSTSEPVLHFGLGENDQIRRVRIQWPSGRIQEFADLPANHRYLIHEPDEETVTVPAASASAPKPWFTDVSAETNLRWLSREKPIDEIAQQRLLPRRLNRLGPALAVGDFSLDGIEDVIIGGTMVDGARFLLGSASGDFVAANHPDGHPTDPVNDGPVLIFDADGDDRNDLLVTKGGNSLPAGSPEYRPRLVLNTGRGFRGAPADSLPPLPLVAGAATAADFDRDGQLDLFIGGRNVPGFYPAAARSALLRNDHGRFVDVTDRLAPGLREIGMVTSALWSDADDDGWPDLCLTLEWGGVKVFRNEAGRSLRDHSERLGFTSAGTGWWNSITTGDFNSDGRIDYALGNLGLNTRFRASPEEPVVLFYGEFRDGSSPLPVLAHYAGGRLVPVASRKELAAAIPAIKRRYRKNDDYAAASLEEILGAERLAAAARLEATELRSGVLLSQPDGTYRFSALPRLAQIAPVHGVVAADFDGDAHTDLCLVQNSFAPAPVIGRFDGGLGLLLRGDGRGGFQPLMPLESGLVVPGDARALVLLDIGNDGWPDVVASRNRDTTQAWRNRGSEQARTLRVSLEGHRGNRPGFGARVTAHYADGTRCAAEVHAGAGYQSQSSPALYFGSPPENPITRLHVRWPRGEETDHSISRPDSRTITLSPSR